MGNTDSLKLLLKSIVEAENDTILVSSQSLGPSSFQYLGKNEKQVTINKS